LPAHPTSILVVDDDEGLLVLMAEALRAEGYEVMTADSGKGARDWLQGHTPDLMLLDLKLKDSDGPALVANLQQEKTLVPFVVVTGQGDEKVAVEVMKQGALDYVMKDTGLIDLLPAVVKRALGSVTQERALAAAQREHTRLEHEVLAVSERERHSIGADLHDGLGQQLTAIELMCAMLKADAAGNPALIQGLDGIGQRLREAIAQTRFLARGLVPVGSSRDALQIGLTELTERTNALGVVRCEFDCPRPVTVSDPFVAGHLYRIAQEALNNVVKHARAGEAIVRLKQIDGALLLEITDNGVGLARKRSGLGLGVMQHRAKAIGGEFTVKSRRGAGVTVRCVLPLRPRQPLPADLQDET
jgi:signal transduction histidine kinase